MEIKPIRTEEDYLATLKEIEALFDAEPDSPEGERLEILVTLVEAYEAKNYKIPLPDPIEAIEYHMERLGLSRKDLEPYIGNRSRVSEVLNRKRPLSLRMIRSLSKGLGIPTEILIQEYPTEPLGEVESGEAGEVHHAKVANVWFSELENAFNVSISSTAGNASKSSFESLEKIGPEFFNAHQDVIHTSANNDCFFVSQSPLFIPDWPTRKVNRCENEQPNQAGNTRLQRIVQ